MSSQSHLLSPIRVSVHAANIVNASNGSARLAIEITAEIDSWSDESILIAIETFSNELATTLDANGAFKLKGGVNGPPLAGCSNTSSNSCVLVSILGTIEEDRFDDIERASI